MAMHRPVRQIEVFDISLMAVVTKAMGAFLVLTVLLLPYYSSSPDIDATTAEAHAQLEQTRKQLDDLARQLADDPQNADALRRLQAALTAAGQKIDDLSKQANALDSQLQRARKEARDAQDDATRAKTAQQRAQVAQAEMEQQANAAAQAARASRAETATMEQQANAATQAARASRAETADMEQQANQLAQSRRAAQTAAAGDEQTTNQLAGIVRHAVLTPSAVLLVGTIPDPDCATASVRAGILTVGTTSLPQGVELGGLGTLGNDLVTRSGGIGDGAELVPPAPGRGAVHANFADFWGDDWRSLLFLQATAPLPSTCRVSVEAQLFDLLHRLVTTYRQAGVAVPAGGAPVMLTAATLAGTDRFPAPTDADRAQWTQWLATPASGGPPPPAP